MASLSWPRVAVVGAGAVGGYFGGMLARAGAHVTLIGRPVHVDVWTRDGLFIDSITFHETIPVAASTEIAASRDADGRGDLLVGDLPGRSDPPRDDAMARVAAWF